MVVFITTYALVLPAITLEKTASCGIEEHQHSDACYEYELTCGQEESEGHHHDDSCYTVTKELDCDLEEHHHSQENGCYDEEGNLICELQEHVHDDSCYKEVKTLTCEMEESEGHHHTDACYEKVLVCDKEVHTHSKECYKDDGIEVEPKDEAADQASSVAVPEDSAGDEAAETAETVVEETLTENFVPELEPLNMEAVFGKKTGFYYFHAEEGQEVPSNSAEITDWQKVEEDTELAPTDLVKMYLPYTIPAGSLNETNPTARYRLPENIYLTDDQIKAINKNENGIAAGYSESDPEYRMYLGAEAIEGDRTPDELLRDGAEEYISAVVRAENVYENDKYIGQDLIFTFVPYTIEQNQTTYDAEKNPVSTGKKITGWFACDFRLDQIDWIEEEKQEETQEEVQEDTQEIIQEESEETDQGADYDPDNEAESASADENSSNITVITIEKTADILFVSEDKDEDIQEIRRTLKQIEKKEISVSEEEKEEEKQEFQSGTLTADGDGYKITLDYTEEAKIPENASLSVREITAETDKEAYEACLAQAQQHVDESGEAKSTVDSRASRFFDIEIQVENEDGTKQKIEPAAPVSVNIQIMDAPADTADSESASKETQNSDPTVLHFAEEGVEQIEASASTGETTVEDNDAESAKDTSESTETTEIRFEAESFSIYGVVYTVDFQYSVDGMTYDFSLPGGGFISFSKLVEVLGILDSTDKGEIDTAREFVADVKSVEFSTPSLVWVGKIENEETVGELKKENKLDVQYSAELTGEQIDRINGTLVESGDWALIGIKPFTSEETLTVTMKDGEVFTIRVTDGQIHAYVISDSGDTYKVTVTYDDTTGIPADAELRVRQLTPDDNRYQKDIDLSNAALLAKYDQESTNPLVFEIKIFANGKEIEPIKGTQVSVEVTLALNAMNGSSQEEGEPEKSAEPEAKGLILFNGVEYATEQADAASARAVHLTDEGEAVVIEDLNGRVDASNNLVMTFETESFSDYLFDGAWGTGLSNLPSTIYVGDEIYMWDQANYWVSNIGTVVTETKANNSDNHKTVTAIDTGTFRIYNRYNQGDYKEITVRAARTGTTPPATINTVDNASIGLTLNLFDYDLDGSLDSYFNNYDHSDNPVSAAFLNESGSINNGNALKFWGSGIGTQHGNCNRYQEHVVANIVNDTLDTGAAGGYPVVKNNAGSQGTRNLSYLFEPADGTDKKAYTNVNHLFKKVGSYYVYDSDENYAYYDVSQGNGGNFVVYNGTYNQKSGSETGSTQNKKIGFFPFHKWDDQYDLYVKWNKNLNHHFGMSMSVDFSLPPDPMAVKDTDNKDVVFEFSGDDDLWVFIDGKLAMDIGGVHQPTDGSINFTNHTVTVNGATQKTTAQFDSLFSNLYDGNKHTLQVFYIERGGCDSNCMIKFNLTQYGDVEFDKVDKENTSDKLGGAVFGIYEDDQCTTPLMWTHKNGDRIPYVAESDANGHVEFEKLPLGNYYMRELKAPDGYPLDPAIHTVSVYLDQGSEGSLVKVKVSINGVDVVTPGVQIENKKPAPIDLGLKKVWENMDGQSIPVPENTSATFELKRIRTYTVIHEVQVDDENEPASHLIVGWVHNGQYHVHNEYDLIAGSTATISWTYVEGYTGAKGCYKNGTEIIKTTPGLTLSEAVTMPAEGETATLYIIDESEHGDAIKGINVSGRQYSGIPGYGFVHEFETITEPDPDFQYTGDHVENNQVTLPIDGDKPWEYDFENLPLVYREPNTATTYSYTYYLEEVSNESPEGTIVIYKDRQGNEINAADDAETNQTGSQTITNRVDLGALELTKNITVTDASGQTQSMTQPNQWVNGTVSFTIDGVEDTFTEGIHHDVEITYAAGEITGYKIDNTQTPVDPAITGTTYSILVNNLVPGDYVIKETGSSNLTLTGITGGKNDADLTAKTVTVTVTHGKNTADQLDTTAKAAYTNNLKTINVPATKTWADLKAGTTHPTIYFRLFYHTEAGDVSVDGVKLKPLPNGTTTVTWENVPEYDQIGQEYVYLVKEYIQKDGGEFTEDGVSYTEAAPNGYVAEEEGLSVTNTESDKYDPRTSYTGRKVWVDTANNGATRPDDLVVKLMVDKTGNGPSADDVEAVNADGQPYTPVWRKDGGEWTYTFNNLPVYDSDWNIVHYYAVETPIAGYDQGEPDITSTQYAYTNSYSAQHIPNDADVTISSEINLLPFMAIETKENAYGYKYHVWTVRVPTDAEKTELIRIFNAERGVNNITLANTRFVSGLPVSKTDDGNVEFLYRKNAYKISISKTSGDILNVAVDGSRYMQDMFVGTLEYDYSAGSTDLQNTLKTEDYDIQKTWGSEQTPPEGAEVQFTLTATIPGIATEENPEPDPVPIADLTTLGIEKPVITLNGGQKEGEEYTGDDTTEESWVYKWESLPQYDKSGNKITYSASETGYTIEGETIDITSEGLVPPATPGGIYELITTNRIPTDNISAQKYWPEGQTVPEGTHIKLAITAKVDDGTDDGTDPNGVIVTPATVTLDGKVTESDPEEVETEDTLWQYTWTNLPKYDKDGKKITYTVAETEYKIDDISYEDLLATANDPAHEGVDFSFTNELPLTEVSVEKTWSNNTGSWPDGVSVIMTLKGSAPIGENGEMKEIESLVLPDIKVGEETVQQTAEYALSSGETSHTWQELPMYTRDGKPITYTVDETGMTYTQPGKEQVPIQNWAQAFDTVEPESGGENNEFIIDNTPKETEISLTKVWTVNGQPKTMEDGDSIEFELYRTDAEGELTLSSDGYEADKGTPTLNKILYVAGGENPGWQTVTISKLPKYLLKLTDDETAAFYTNIAYYAVETNVTGDTRISYTLSLMNAGSDGEGSEDGGDPGTTGSSETTDPTQSAINTGTITIYNRDTDVDITVIKVDEKDSDTKLPNAEFQILKWKDDNERYLAYNLETKTYASPGEESKSKLTTGQEQGPDYGKLVFEGLTDGKYKIVETKAPEGYIRESDVEIFFSIDDGTVTWTDEEGNSINTDTKPNQIDYDAEDLAFTVGNTPGAALPYTGGPGTRLFTILGSILIAGAGMLLWRRRRTI